MWMLPLHVNQKSDYDDDDEHSKNGIHFLRISKIRCISITEDAGKDSDEMSHSSLLTKVPQDYS